MEEKRPFIPPVEVADNADTAPTVGEVKAKIHQEVSELVAWVSNCQSLTFFEFETQLVPKVLALGCLFVQLFLCMRHEQFRAMHPQPEPGHKRIGPHSRLLGTVFGKVRYGRTYSYRKGEGYYPWMSNKMFSGFSNEPASEKDTVFSVLGVKP